MNFWTIASYAAWIISALIFLWMLWTLWMLSDAHGTAS